MATCYLMEHDFSFHDFRARGAPEIFGKKDPIVSMR